MKIALVHDFLVEYGGGEKVLEAFHEMWPKAPVFTAVYNKKLLKNWPDLKNWDVRVPGLTKIPLISKVYKYFTFLYPLAIENFDLREFDLIVSSSTFLAKGVLTRPGQIHLAYIHTPARFLYHLPTETSDKRSKWYWKILLGPIDFFLRIWDFNAAQRPDVLIANSETTAKRIRKFYNRVPVIINPPVDLTDRTYESHKSHETSYFLSVSRLCAYKNVDLIIKAFNKLKLPLTVVGSGREENALKSLAGETIKFTGFVTNEELKSQYQNCRAFISAVSDEDFGITPVEAMGYGKPVIAFRSGGVTETVVEGKTGIFFNELAVDSLCEAVKKFENMEFDPKECRKQAEKFSKETFKEKMRKLVVDSIKKE